VKDGEDGLLVDGGDVMQLAAALSAMRADDRAVEMGRAAYENYWCDPLSIERHVRRSIDAYDIKTVSAAAA
jgi:glycosyltransferase involved in cell wall biosynthesis